MSEAKRYEAALNAMFAAFLIWRKANPQATPQVQFNFPRTVGVIAPISDALKTHWVSVNDDGRDLIAALCAPFTKEKEPTVFMVRAVLEYEPAYRGRRC